MSVVVSSGYTLHYFDEWTGDHVSIPLEDLVEANFPSIATACGGVVLTHDEVGTFTYEDVERLSSLRPLRHERDLERAMTPGDETTERRVAYIEADYSGLEVRALAQGALVVGADFDRRALTRAFAKPDLDNLSPYAPLEKRRPDWQDRGRQHKNRKKRSWRR